MKKLTELGAREAAKRLASRDITAEAAPLLIMNLPK
jgi:hypothetical protein